MGDGAQRARRVARATLAEVKDRMGLPVETPMQA